MDDATHVVCPHDGALNRVPAERLREKPRCGRCHQELFIARPLDLSSSNFDRHVGTGDLPLLVDFWAPWCGPCRAMAPFFDRAAAVLEPDLRLARLNTEQEPAIANRYGIRSIPTLILFAGRQEIARHSGTMGSADHIVQWANAQRVR